MTPGMDDTVSVGGPPKATWLTRLVGWLGLVAIVVLTLSWASVVFSQDGPLPPYWNSWNPLWTMTAISALVGLVSGWDYFGPTSGQRNWRILSLFYWSAGLTLLSIPVVFLALGLAMARDF